ncbi:hypothetical protein OB955_24970 [Halobacteria archaeon AArc-m2/3/4]|uniref:PGF-CTERM protein n=1 Tax=Natronoglomus mannanivorans TaxID=2979990 RepID=A0ABT2QLW5_9EURY|nr:hypothetical protein [Halobacteria archaeon AArc-m2/3/4]
MSFDNEARNGPEPSFSEDETTESIDYEHGASLTRRQMMIATAGVALAVSATGTAAAASYNFESEYAPTPRVPGSVTIDEHTAGMTSALEYIADDESDADYRDDGVSLAPRDDEDEPHNPVRYWPDRVDSSEFRAFPRGETREVEEDGETVNEDISWTDVDEWTIDVGAGSVDATSAASGADAIVVSADGDETIARFDAVDIDSGVARKYIQAIVRVEDVGEESAVSIRAVDANDGSELLAGADVELDGPNTYVVQKQIGELEGADDLGAIDAVEVVADDCDVTIAGLNMDRASAWSFGTTEVVDEESDDDELTTETVREPVGEVALADVDDGPLSTLDSAFGDATIRDLDVDIELDVGGLSEDAVELDVVDAPRHSPDRRMRLVVNFELPTAYALEYNALALEDTVAHPSDRHRVVEFVTGEEDPVTLEAIDDEDVDGWVSRTVDYRDGDLDDELTLTSSVNAGEVVSVYYEILVTDSEESELEDTSGVAMGPTDSESGGFFATLFSIPGIIASALGIAGIRAWFARRT